MIEVTATDIIDIHKGTTRVYFFYLEAGYTAISPGDKIIVKNRDGISIEVLVDKVEKARGCACGGCKDATNVAVAELISK